MSRSISELGELMSLFLYIDSGHVITFEISGRYSLNNLCLWRMSRLHELLPLLMQQMWSVAIMSEVL